MNREIKMMIQEFVRDCRLSKRILPIAFCHTNLFKISGPCKLEKFYREEEISVAYVKTTRNTLGFFKKNVDDFYKRNLA